MPIEQPLPSQLPSAHGELSVGSFTAANNNLVGVWGIVGSEKEIAAMLAAGPTQSAAGFFQGKVAIAAADQSGLAISGPGAGVGAGIVLQVDGGTGWEILATGKSSSQGADKFNIRDLARVQDVFTIDHQGNVWIPGDLILENQDCAEEFDVACEEPIEAGTVMVLDDEGRLKQSESEYDKKVAGVVSGAGACKAAIVLGRQRGMRNRLPIALLGKTYCKVDADYGPINVGDLLTTSQTPGHAMRAGDSARAFGAVIGKALRPWKRDRGLVPILIALQ